MTNSAIRETRPFPLVIYFLILPHVFRIASMKNIFQKYIKNRNICSNTCDEVGTNVRVDTNFIFIVIKFRNVMVRKIPGRLHDELGDVAIDCLSDLQMSDLLIYRPRCKNKHPLSSIDKDSKWRIERITGYLLSRSWENTIRKNSRNFRWMTSRRVCWQISTRNKTFLCVWAHSC